MKFLEERLLRRPRILNVLHSMHLVRATSQTIERELQMIEKYAAGKRVAVEIGSYQGVSAARIAKTMAEDGTLYCVDPWESRDGKMNPCRSIFVRHIDRCGVSNKIRSLQMLSSGATDLIPSGVEFIFVDGDHSWTGIESDWSLVRQKLRVGGTVCLHDSLVPSEEPWRQPDSVGFFSEIIVRDSEFELIDSVYSLVVLVRKPSVAP
jgi:predicted O-methyltransferase YrrM